MQVRSRSWKASKPSSGGLACTSARRGRRGLHHLVWEIVDNSIDEALAGHCSEILVTVHPDNSVSVTDDGRGMPVGKMEKYGKSAAEVIMTTLHAGGKFDGQGYKVSGGLHGVGASVVNALSEWLEVEIRREGHVWSQRYERGFPKGDLTKDRKLKKGEGTGTTISFMPDPEVFTETVELSFDTLSRRFRESAFLNKGLKIRLVDEREEDRDVTYQYEGGIRDFVEHINEAKDPVHKTVFYLEREEEVGDVEVAMQWNSGFQDSVFTFANNINTHEGGAHLSGFRSALSRTINAYARQKGLLKEKEESLTGDDIREGLAAVISVKLQEPQFEGQTKTKLGNTEVKGLVESATNRYPGRVPGGASWRGQGDRQQGVAGRAGAARGQDGEGEDPQGLPGELDAAGQARRLLFQGPCEERALHRRGRLGRRIGQRQGGTETSRPYCPCGARSSTSRRPTSTRSSPTSRYRP